MAPLSARVLLRADPPLSLLTSGGKDQNCHGNLRCTEGLGLVGNSLLLLFPEKTGKPVNKGSACWRRISGKLPRIPMSSADSFPSVLNKTLEGTVLQEPKGRSDRSPEHLFPNEEALRLLLSQLSQTELWQV